MGSFLEDYVNLENKYNKLANDNKELQDQISLIYKCLKSEGFDLDELMKKYKANPTT